MGRLLDLFTSKYNYTDFHELNLDWIIQEICAQIIELDNFVNLNTIKYADPIQWNITTQYQANTVVIDGNNGTAYLSTKPVPSGVALTNTDYWTVIFTLDITSANQNITFRNDGSNVLATFPSNVDDWLLWNGYLYKVTRSINTNEAYVVGYNLDRYTVELYIREYITALSNIIGDLTDLNTTDKTSIVNAINEVLTVAHTGSIVNVIDFNPTLNGADDSLAVQAAFDFAKDNNASIVTFYGINEISFKNVNIDSSCTIFIGDTKINAILIDNVNERTQTIFNINNEDIDVELIGGEFVGGYTTGVNNTQYHGDPLINVTQINTLTIKDGYYHKFNNTNYGPAESAIIDRTPVLFKVLDSKQLNIINNIIDDIYGDETIFCIDNLLNREDVNMLLKDNHFKSNIHTSSIDFIGNHIEMCGNRYDYDYGGSALNCFGLDIYAHDELFTGTLGSLYDTSESIYFTGNTARFENINANLTAFGVLTACKETIVDGININGKNPTETNLAVVRLTAGNGGSVTLHKDVATQKVLRPSVALKNCDLYGTSIPTFICNDNSLDAKVVIDNVNCSSVSSASLPTFIAAGCDLVVRNSKLHPDIIPSLSGSNRFCYGMLNAAQSPKSLSFINCIIDNYNANNVEFLMNAPGIKAVVVGCMANANVVDKIYAGTTPLLAEAANLNLTT